MYKNILKQTEHRNYPLPEGKWIAMQDWEHLLFMHWRVYSAFIEPHLPKGLELDTFDGEPWISIIPFRVGKMRIRKMPPLPFMYPFVEVNVRTYVKRDGIPGVYFFSMDASKLLAVLGARFATLPYFHAKMKLKKKGKKFNFKSIRKDKEKETLKLSYQPSGKLFIPEEGTIDHWLMNRFALWSYKYDTLFRGDIHHKQWKVQHADLDIDKETITSFMPNNASISKPLAHYAKSKRVLIWPLKKAE